MPKTVAIPPKTGSRRTYVICRDRLSNRDPAALADGLALAMAGDMGDVVARRGECTEDDLARLGWARDDIRALGDAARAHLLSGAEADRLRALQLEQEAA